MPFSFLCLSRISSGMLLAGSLFGGFTAAAQQARQATGSHTISWTGVKNLTIGDQAVKKAVGFTGATFTENGLPVWRLTLANQAIEGISLTNAVYQPLTQAEAALIPASYLATQPETKAVIGLENGQPVTDISIIPIRVTSSGQKEKLVSFSFTTRQGQNPAGLRGQNNTFATESKLNSGTFYRLAVTNSGIFKIDAPFLSSLGLNPSQVNPQHLKIYGKGGGMLPQPNAAPRHDDLVENAIMVSADNNGSFDGGEFALFYGEGPHTWHIDNSGQYKRQQNYYSDTTYYFLTIGNTPGLRIGQKPSLPSSGAAINTFDERIAYEKELTSLVISGREWLGEKLTSFNPTHEVIFPTQGLVPGSSILLRTNLVNTATYAGVSFAVALNGQSWGNLAFAHTPNGACECASTSTYGPKGYEKNGFFNKQLPTIPNELKVKFTFSGGNSSTVAGFIDWLVMTQEKQLALYGNQTAFRKRLGQTPASVGTFQVNNVPAQGFVWDVTNPVRPALQQGNFSGNTFSFTADSLSAREFVVFEGSGFPAPINVGTVAQQNLHALNLNGDLDLVIVTHPNFKTEAQRLAAHRTTHDGLNVAIVTPQQVYNEFSSGAQDITAIRDMMRMVYERRQPNKRLYLLLFGDASYDYKNRIANNSNFVPIYESPESLDDVATYSSDDYFGFMDLTEGQWTSDDKMEIGIGRLPAANTTDAAVMVDKLIHYDSPSSFGKWRTNVVLTADDSDGNNYFNDAEWVAKGWDTTYTAFNIRKLYLDAFNQVTVASGERSPEFISQLNQAVEKGALLVNYIGHGGETGWASERVLEISQINQWQNLDKLAFFVTATCEFGRYDDPSRASGAEHMLYSPLGGGIGLLTTTRPVWSHTNSYLNKKLSECILKPIGNEMPRLGDVVRITKNTSTSGDNNRNFALLGDPTARLAYPEHNIEVTAINNTPVAATPDTLQALAVVRIDGRIVDAAGNVKTDFNQTLHATVYEKETTVQTLGDETGSVANFKARQNIIYDGQATVNQGTFYFEFVVPLDIAYNLGYGKISLYSNTSTTDASGAYTNILIGGTDTAALGNDNQPPQVKLFLNDESFVFGGTAGTDSYLLANLSDDNGINTVGSGIGHEIKATLDDNHEFILNDYYTADVNSFRSGKIKYPLKDLAPGPHSIKVKAWDTHNNSNDPKRDSGYLEFIVVNDAKLALEHVLNYPNPFSNQTTFHFDHNRAGDQLEVLVQVFTVSGKLVKTLSQQASDISSRSHNQALTWDGRDEYNDRLSKGIYVYKVSVRSLRDGSKAHEYQKLVILN